MEAELQRAQGIELRWKEAEQRAQEAEQRAREAERRAQEAEKQARERLEQLYQVRDPLLAHEGNIPGHQNNFQSHEPPGPPGQQMSGNDSILQASTQSSSSRPRSQSHLPSESQARGASESEESIGGHSKISQQSIDPVHNTAPGDSPATSANMPGSFEETTMEMSEPSYARHYSVDTMLSTIPRESPLSAASYMHSDPEPAHSMGDARVDVDMRDATYSPRIRFVPRTRPVEENSVISPISV